MKWFNLNASLSNILKFFCYNTWLDTRSRNSVRCSRTQAGECSHMCTAALLSRLQLVKSLNKKLNNDKVEWNKETKKECIAKKDEYI